MSVAEPKTTQIVRRSLHHELVERMREMIVEGELRPGEKIPEIALSVRFGVSRTPLRESLKALAAEGLVSLLPNRGAIVSVITEQEIDELFPIIGVLEALAGEIACARATDERVAAFRKLHEQMVAQYEAGDESGYRRTNRQFHEMLFDIAGNAALRETYQSLLVRIHSARFILRKDAGDWKDAIADHAGIVAAFEARDNGLLALLLKRHLTETAARTTHNSLARERVQAS